MTPGAEAAAEGGGSEYEPWRVRLRGKVKPFLWGFALGAVLPGSYFYFALAPQIDENRAAITEIERGLGEMRRARVETARTEEDLREMRLVGGEEAGEGWGTSGRP